MMRPKSQRATYLRLGAMVLTSTTLFSTASCQPHRDLGHADSGGPDRPSEIDADSSPFVLAVQPPTASSAGAIQTRDDRIHCGLVCTTTVAPGAGVELIAVPAPGHRFVRWTGDCVDSTNHVAACTLHMDGPKSVGAEFKRKGDCTETTACAGDRTVTSAKDLLKMRDCSSLEGGLRIENTSVTHLTGLECLTSITSTVSILGNATLTNLTGLKNLASIGGHLVIDSNPVLKSLKGLENLTSVSWGVYIENNYALESFRGLEKLTSIGGGLFIENNDSLENLAGLENLASIGWVLITNNATLTSLDDLKNLTCVGEDWYVVDNVNLGDSADRSILARLEDQRCTCLENTAGEPCKPCTSNSCAGHGRCDDTSGKPVCECQLGWNPDDNCATCAEGFHEPYCIKNSTCRSNSCAGHGRCDDTSGKPVCECQLGWNPDDNCATCAEGFYGPNCDIDCTAADDCSGDRIIENAKDLRDLRSCSFLEGSLIVQSTNVTSLEGLECLSSITSTVCITSNSALTSLTGLERLTSIGGDLVINYNAGLISPEGLKNLTSVTSTVTVIGNEALINLTGLQKLTGIGGDLVIANNAALTSLTGLEHLTSIDGDLYIDRNRVLPNLTGLNGLSFIRGNMVVWFNDALKSLAGLDKLTSIRGALVSWSNDVLTNLTGLGHLTSIGRDLDIWDNSAMTSLSGLTKLTSINGDLNIEDNDALPACEAEGFAARLNKECRCSNNSGACTTCSGNTCAGRGWCDDSSEEVDCACNEGWDAADNCASCAKGFHGPNCDIDCPGTIACTDDRTIENADDLDALIHCSSLDGDLMITNTNVTDLGKLKCIHSIKGTLNIVQNHALLSLAGLKSLTSVGGLGLWQNDALTSLTGLENLTSIEDDVDIRFNGALTSLTGLQHLTSIEGWLSIRSNGALTSLAGLDKLTSIEGALDIRSNGALTSLAGLDKLTFVEGAMTIQKNGKLPACKAQALANRLGEVCDCSENEETKGSCAE